MELDSTLGLQQHLNIFHKNTKGVKRCENCAIDFDMSLLYVFHMELQHANDAVVQPQQVIKTEQAEEEVTSKVLKEAVELVTKNNTETNADFIDAEIEMGKQMHRKTLSSRSLLFPKKPRLLPV